MMAPTLYMFLGSPPVRAVLITAKSIGLEFNEKQLDLLKKEHLSPEYIKLNPQHTIPTLVEDDGFVLWDSHAIMTYIVSKYAKNDSLYPKDLKKRARIDQRLHFESGVLFPSICQIMWPVIFKGEKVSQENLDKMNEVYNLLEVFLGDVKWMAGDDLTIADYSILTSVTNVGLVAPIDSQKHPKLAEWYQRMEALPECERNKKGVEQVAEIFKAQLANK